MEGKLTSREIKSDPPSFTALPFGRGRLADAIGVLGAGNTRDKRLETVVQKKLKAKT